MSSKAAAQPAQYHILLDTPAPQPALDFDKYAAALQKLIEHSNPRFAIGVFGTWGSGKTTLMETIRCGLDKEKCIPVWFSAWRYEKEPHLIVPLLDTIREALIGYAENREPIKDLAWKTAGIIGKATHSLLSGLSIKLGIPGAAEFSFDANKALTKAKEHTALDESARTPRSFYHASFSALSEAFTQFVGSQTERRIVVFVDDLDRCLPETALEVLESMKLFFDLPGFVFVVGLDEQVVEAAIELKYIKLGSNSPEKTVRVKGSDYIKKIFQVPFSLRPVPVTEVNNFLSTIISDPLLPQTQKNELQTTVGPHLQYLVSGDGINPRELKRYINAYFLQRQIKPHLNSAVTLAMQTIYFRGDWDPIKQQLLAYRDVFINAVRDSVQTGANVAGVNPEFGTIPTAFLDYVSANRPGAPLLTAGDLTEYIYAGEAASSTSSYSIAEFVKQLAQLRQEGNRSNASGTLRDLQGKLSQTGADNAFRRTINTQLTSLDDLLTKAATGEPSENYEKHVQDSITTLLKSFVQWQRSS
jgi:KAP family P-loop domain